MIRSTVPHTLHKLSQSLPPAVGGEDVNDPKVISKMSLSLSLSAKTTELSKKLPDVDAVDNMKSVDLIVETPPVAVSLTEVSLPVVQAELSLLHLADLKQVVDRLGADHRVVVVVGGVVGSRSKFNILLVMVLVSLRVDLLSRLRRKY